MRKQLGCLNSVSRGFKGIWTRLPISADFEPPRLSWGVQRRIVHIDMDAFYASVEQRDDTGLRGKAVAVGYDHPRGVVMTASYQARRFGVGSAMPSRMARDRCPELIIVEPRMEVYRQVSQQVRAVFRRYTDLVEPLSLDEAYLDVTDPKLGPTSGTLSARAIKRDIAAATDLTASAGVSYCKFLAKAASALNKPDGLTVITPDQAEAFVAEMPVEQFSGIGPVTARRLLELGVRTGAELRTLPLANLEQSFGKQGRHFFELARGVDERPVEPDRPYKSISAETTFGEDLSEIEALIAELPALAEHTAGRLAKAGLVAGGVQIKLKYSDHQVITRRMTVPERITEAEDIRSLAERLLRSRVELARPVRLLGVATFDLSEQGETNQPALFDSV